MKRIVLVLFLLLICAAVAQIQSAPAPLHIEVDYWEGAVILSLNMFDVAPHTTGRFTGEVVFEKEGWFTFSPDDIGDRPEFSRKDIRYTISNASRPDLLCKSRDEMFVNYANGSPSWPNLREYGYHLRAGDHLKVTLEVDNRFEKPIQDGAFMIDLKFQPINEPSFRRDAYPMWFNSRGCGPAGFDLKPGKNISSGTFEIPVTGTLVALQGALREHAEYLDVENRSREKSFLHQVWTGPAQPLPLITPPPGTEFRVDQGDFVAIAAEYNNPDKVDAKAAGAGVALGLFIPVDDTKVAQFTKKPPQAEQ